MTKKFSRGGLAHITGLPTTYVRDVQKRHTVLPGDDSNFRVENPGTQSRNWDGGFAKRLRPLYWGIPYFQGTKKN